MTLGGTIHERIGEADNSSFIADEVGKEISTAIPKEVKSSQINEIDSKKGPLLHNFCSYYSLTKLTLKQTHK